MLRRYLIVNAVTTALLYAAFWLYAPSLSGLIHNARHGIEVYAMDSVVLGPIMHRIVLVSGR